MMFKLSFHAETYLFFNVPHRLRRALAKFRISNHNLEIEKGRQLGINTEDRICKLCVRNDVPSTEDEFHVLLECKS